MAEIINFRQARKARARDAQAAQASANRARHGATKAERKLAQDEADRTARTLDHARREDS